MPPVTNVRLRFTFMIRARILGLILLLAILSIGNAGEPPQRQRDAQSAFEPSSQPGAGQKLLQQFVGDWEVVKTLTFRPGAPVRTTGECHQSMFNDGRFLKSEFVFTQNGTKTTGLGIIGFEPRSGKFTSVWTGSRQTRMSIRQSQDPFKGSEIILYSVSLEGGTQPRRSRTVTHLEDKDKLIHRQYAAGPDGKERLVMELVMTRKGETAAPRR
jgi:hypothetical protein